MPVASCNGAPRRPERPRDVRLNPVARPCAPGILSRASGFLPPQEEEEEIILTEEVEQSASPNALPTIPLFSDLPREAFIAA